MNKTCPKCYTISYGNKRVCMVCQYEYFPKKKRAPASPEATQARKDRWKYTSFLGHATMMQKQANAILNSPLVNDAVRAKAQMIMGQAFQMRKELEKGKEPQ